MVTHALVPKSSKLVSLPYRGRFELAVGRVSFPVHLHSCAIHNDSISNSSSNNEFSKQNEDTEWMMQWSVSSSPTCHKTTHRSFTHISSPTIRNGFTLHASPSPSSRRFFSVWTTMTNRRNVVSYKTMNKEVRCIYPSSMVQNRLFASKKRDFYDLLGVPKGSDKATIKKAYFNLAKKYHPDTNKGDDKAADKFKEVTEAYEVLTDDKQRELYDSYGHAGVDPNSGFGAESPFGQGGFQGFNFGDGSFHFSTSGGGGAEQIDPEELFEAFFGKGNSRRKRGPRKGADLQGHVRLTFREAVFGASKELDIRYQEADPKTGRVEVKERQVTVQVPAGIDSGMNLRLSGQGADGSPGAPRGNLIVTVVVEEDDYFHRDGVDVHVNVPISIIQAILGGTVEVKTLDGVVEMKIPKGSQPDAKLMMRGKGIPYVNGRERGNQIVHLKIQIPKEITSRQEDILREFDKETEKSGLGICGRLASAAGSAFDSLFRGGHKKEKDTDSSSEQKANKDEDKTDEGDVKKQMAP